MSPKAERFVTEYLIDLNATQAAIRSGYSAKTANEQGARLLTNVSVRSAIEAAKAERAKRTEIDADWVLRRLHAEATADMSELYDDAGNLLPIKEWPMVFRQGLVVGFETEHERDGKGEEAKGVVVRKIKMLDRSKTIELIGKHTSVGAFKERVEIDGSLTIKKSAADMTDEELAAIAARKK